MSDGELDPMVVGAILHESWRRKRELATNVTTSRIDQWYDTAMTAGAEGGKLSARARVVSCYSWSGPKIGHACAVLSASSSRSKCDLKCMVQS